jgi:hypothetical protein
MRPSAAEPDDGSNAGKPSTSEANRRNGASWYATSARWSAGSTAHAARNTVTADGLGSIAQSHAQLA